MDINPYKPRKRSAGSVGYTLHVPGVNFPNEKLSAQQVTGMGNTVKVYKLSPEELEYYRNLPVPKKSKDYTTLAVRDKARPTTFTTHRDNPYGGKQATR
ncbi:hypothetical protein J31TS4_18830 [Paenibacillus sp. J31TS4]|uniref:hypothetical protein n=1 Tax=Paenibacillus sp. J31TS4 TaxID=2807195 RepID=UPI001B1AC8C0|nr:hypothetical protein [Paenibacillus sp. J31TS4]GIP38603.1 hypothetical protein J31TS4_18830 [Paenibacillus sp. J31TS4]